MARSTRTEDRSRLTTIFIFVVIVLVGFVGGLILTLLAESYKVSEPSLSNLLTNVGTGLLSTALISVAVEFVWSRQLTQAEKAELEDVHAKLSDVVEQLSTLEGRLEAFKQLGFNGCYLKYNRRIMIPKRRSSCPSPFSAGTKL